MERDPADRGLDHATRAAHEAVRGLVNDGPVRLVTEELARLDHETERAEQAAERWEQIAARLDTQRAAHRAEDGPGEQADDGRDDAAARDKERSHESPNQVARGEITAQRAERGRRGRGAAGSP